jgi:hypothetical protein
MGGVAEEAGKVASTAVESMKSVPLAIALLVVNAAFLGFNGYVLSEVSANARERNKDQMELIGRLVKDCRSGLMTPQGGKSSSNDLQNFSFKKIY